MTWLNEIDLPALLSAVSLCWFSGFSSVSARPSQSTQCNNKHGKDVWIIQRVLLPAARHLSVGKFFLIVRTAHPKTILNLLPKFHAPFSISRVATAARNRHIHIKIHTHTHIHIHTKTVHFMVLKVVNLSRIYTPNTEIYKIMLRHEVILLSKRIHIVEFTVIFYKILLYVGYDFKLNDIIGDK